MVYTPTGSLIAGFSTDKPEPEAASNGDYDKPQYPASAPTLFFWISYFGREAGDRQILRIMAPDGKEIANYDQKAKKGKMLIFDYVGIKAPDGGFPPGTYRAEFQLLRGDSGSDKLVASMARTVDIR
jgi:hypothetical protein